jgi:Ca2+/Na+ antiporter
MKYVNKILVLLFVLLFIAVVPIQFLYASWSYIEASLHLAFIFSSYENFHIIIVATILFVIFAAMRLKKLVSWEAGGYSILAIVILLTMSLLQKPLNFFQTLVILVIVLAISCAVYLYEFRSRRRRFIFLAPVAASLVIAYLLPLYVVVFYAFFLFVAVAFVRPQLNEMQQEVAKSDENNENTPKTEAAPPNEPEQPGGTVKVDQATPDPRTIIDEVPPDLDSIPQSVSWPSQSDYSRAMQNLEFSIAKERSEVLTSKVVPNPYVSIPGNVVYSSGNYGTVFKLQNEQSTHALKCFTRSKPDLSKRYYLISKAISRFNDGSTFASFSYLPKTIRTLKNPAVYFPALMMEWIDGVNLNTYITSNIETPRKISDIAKKFLSVAIRLQSYGISHGDLSGDNILVNPSGEITLVDYDGMYVPSLKGMKAPENGHDHFQHPNRTTSTYSERLDNFSVLVIYLSLLAVASDPSLWDRYNRGDQDCLLFRKRDFLMPDTSPLIAELLAKKGRIRKLTKLLVEALQHDPLWDVIDPEKLAKIQR